MRGLRGIALALTLAVIAVPIEAANWTPVSEGGAAGRRTLTFIDRASVKRQGERLTLDAVMVYQKPSPAGVKRTIEHSLVDCSDETSQALHVRMFDSAGKQLHAFPGNGKWEVYPEGSAWRILVKTVCDGSYPKTATATPISYAEKYFRK